jgi:hypothetical protein
LDNLDIKILSWNVWKIDDPADPEFPFRMRLRYTHPSLTAVAYTLLFGPYDELVCQAKSLKAIMASLQETGALAHPLFVSVVVWNREGNEVYRYPLSSTD